LCLDPNEFQPEALCLALDDTCEELAERVSATHSEIAWAAEDFAPELLEQTTACQWLRVERLISECGWSTCGVLCERLLFDCDHDCTPCDAAAPDEALALMRALVERPLACPSCELCTELGSDVCAQISGC
jgi:hypothetical protein